MVPLIMRSTSNTIILMVKNSIYQMDRQIDRLADRQIDGKTVRQTDRQADRQEDSQTDRQRGILQTVGEKIKVSFFSLNLLLGLFYFVQR